MASRSCTRLTGTHAGLDRWVDTSAAPRRWLFHKMLDAVQNHSARIVVVDELRDAEDVEAARTIANQGVVLIATAHRTGLTHLVHNPTLSPLIGGMDSAMIGDPFCFLLLIPQVVAELHLARPSSKLGTRGLTRNCNLTAWPGSMPSCCASNMLLGPPRAPAHRAHGFLGHRRPH